MKPEGIALVRRAAGRGLVPAEAVGRAEEAADVDPLEWLLDQKLLTRDQLRILLESDAASLPRSAARDSSWTSWLLLTIVLIVLVGAGVGYTLMRAVHQAQVASTQAQAQWASRVTVMQATATLRTGDPRGAIQALSREVASNPANGQAWTLLAEAHLATGDPESAASALQTAFTLDLGTREMFLLRARILLAQGKAVEAVAELQALAPGADRDPLLDEAKKKAVEK